MPKTIRLPIPVPLSGVAGSTPIYDALVAERGGFDPRRAPTPDNPTKNQRRKAGVLTGQVWATINGEG